MSMPEKSTCELVKDAESEVINKALAILKDPTEKDSVEKIMGLFLTHCGFPKELHTVHSTGINTPRTNV